MTGYTHELIEKKQTFPQFAMNCARAFGALIEMRDDPHNAPIPEKMEPSDYHLKAQAAAQIEHARLLALTPAELLDHGRALKDREINGHLEYIEKCRTNIAGLTAMLKEVTAWKPPTEEHEGLKKFMLEQLTMSIDSETMKYAEEDLKRARAKSPEEFAKESIKREKDSIQYHANGYTKDVKRAGGNTDWVAALRKSLAPA